MLPVTFGQSEEGFWLFVIRRRNETFLFPSARPRPLLIEMAHFRKNCRHGSPLFPSILKLSAQETARLLKDIESPPPPNEDLKVASVSIFSLAWRSCSARAQAKL